MSMLNNIPPLLAPNQSSPLGGNPISPNVDKGVSDFEDLDEPRPRKRSNKVVGKRPMSQSAKSHVNSRGVPDMRWLPKHDDVLCWCVLLLHGVKIVTYIAPIFIWDSIVKILSGNNIDAFFDGSDNTLYINSIV
ncbi:uncharacterized protein A4U43_C07F30630 [Asparagus officinalis]|uniref:Uncharacterized protein n=1 Tax=Asparagus officinalis TaxID=4686 RepID=A0A5P1ELC6_ASPOF|nr:uncharacterized protein A4U43_C07F30630 [Asparagus officinalis]